MKFSPQTITILQNFGKISSNIAISPGNLIRTRNCSSTIYAECTVPDRFDKPLAFFDLNQFMSMYTMIPSPNLEIKEKYVTIVGSDGTKTKYFQSNPAILNVPDKSIKDFDAAVEFTIEESTLASVKKAAAVLGVDYITFLRDGDNIVCRVWDPDNPTSNNHEVVIGKTESKDSFQFTFLMEQLCMIPGDYDVSVASEMVAMFTNVSESMRSLHLKYWLAQHKRHSSYSQG